MILRWFILFGVAFLGLESLASFTLEKHGDRYNLTARNADLRAILDAIDEREEALLQFFGEPEGIISLTVFNQGLDDLLARLGVSFTLVYEANEAGDYRLDSAMLLDSRFLGLDPQTLAELKAAVMDLYDDDIYMNAHRASWLLRGHDCEMVAGLLQPKLYADDYQARHLAASILRSTCANSTNAISQRLLEVTVELLGREGYRAGEFQSLFTPGEAYAFFLHHPEWSEQARPLLYRQFFHGDAQAKFLSAGILAVMAGSDYSRAITRTLAHHLKDNDLRGDGQVAAYGLYMMGEKARLHLMEFRNSPDQQQAELVDLIFRAWDEGTPEVHFDPVMFIGGYRDHPLLTQPWASTVTWNLDNFPNDQGEYSQLKEERMMRADYYRWDRMDGSYGEDDESEPWVATPLDSVEPFRYTVLARDDLPRIGMLFGVTVDSIMAINPGLTASSLVPGQQIFIPW
ncbi:MAG TPA: LysM peptidoglycan-binding domain-containing protein [Kiritimatiellia bacterium]|nr:LysM peptidoglycan-binding domain-containing protein [Kiritimatiellia bacterium]